MEYVARFRRVLEDAAEGGYGHYAHPPVAADEGEALAISARTGLSSPLAAPTPPRAHAGGGGSGAHDSPTSTPRSSPAEPSPSPPRLSPAALAKPLLVRRASLMGARFWFESTAPPGAEAALALGNAGQNFSELGHPSVSRPASSSLYSPLAAAPSPDLRAAAEAAAAAAAAEEEGGGAQFAQRTPHALRPAEHITAAGWHGGRGGGAEEERRARAAAAAAAAAVEARQESAEAPTRLPAGGTDGDTAWRRAREEGAAYITGGVAEGEALLKGVLADAFAAWAPGTGGAGGGEDSLVDAAALCALLHEAAESAEAEAGGRGAGESKARAKRVYRAQGTARDLP